MEVLLSALRIYSPTGHESQLARSLASQMKEVGYSRVRLDRAGNVLGEVGHGDRRLLLCGHMDTVPGKLKVARRSDKIFGRGAADAKSPLCALMLAGAESADAGLHITFAGVTEEEGEGAGINTMMRGMPRYDYAIFGEPGGASRITIGYRGRVGVDVTVRTDGGHASSPWAHRSAFAEFEFFLSRLKELESGYRAESHFNSVSISPTMVRAGGYHNVLPSICESSLDVRIPPGVSATEVVEGIQGSARDCPEGVTIHLTVGEATDAYQVDPGSDVVRALQRAILTRLPQKPSLVRKTGTGDMNVFAARSGALCATYGPGLLDTSHTKAEAVEVKDYLDSIEVLKEAIRQLGTMAMGNRR